MEQCRVITPCGAFTAVWPDDEEQRVKYEGDFDAIAFFRNYLETEPVSGPNGRRLQFETIEPDELRGFCDAPEKGVIVEQSFDEVADDE